MGQGKLCPILGTMKKTISFLLAFLMGLLCVAPPLNYDIPMMVNSYLWLYLVVASGLIAFFVLFQSNINEILKVLIVYLFVVGCFFSQIPYFSFHAFMLVTATICFFLLAKECEFETFLNMAQAIFWIEIVLATLHYFGKDTLMNFGRQEPVFLGTIFQHMRFGSLLCILSPFLLVKSKWYIIPILVSVILTTSSGFALSVAAGLIIYSFLTMRRYSVTIISLIVILVCLYAVTLGRDSFAVAFREGRLPIWWVVIKTWVLDTRGSMVPNAAGHMIQTGPWDWKAFIFGHGLDTFYAAFPAYKHDPAPFPQAHNSWLQLAWETGLVGFCLFTSYCAWLIRQLYCLREFLLISGLVIIGTNMVFHFPDRMTQTNLLMVAFVAYCEKIIKKGFSHANFC